MPSSRNPLLSKKKKTNKGAHDPEIFVACHEWLVP